MTKRRPPKPPTRLWDLLSAEEKAALEKENAEDCEMANRLMGQSRSPHAPELTNDQFGKIVSEMEALLGKPIRPLPRSTDDPDDIPF